MQSVIDQLVNEYYAVVPRSSVGMPPVSVALLLMQSGKPGDAHRVLFDNYPPAKAQAAWEAVRVRPMAVSQPYTAPVVVQPVRQATALRYTKPSGVAGPTESKMSVVATLLALGIVGTMFWWTTSGGPVSSD